MSEYQIWLCNPLGDRLEPLDDFVSLDALAATNEVASLRLIMPNRAGLWQMLARDSRIEVWRTPTGGTIPDLIFDTIFLLAGRKRRRGTTSTSNIEIIAVAASDLLRRRQVDYAASTSQAQKNGITAAVMGQIVEENLGVLAGSGRVLNSSLVGFDISALAGGPTQQKQCAWRSVLAVLRELSQASVQQGNAVFFDLTAQRTDGVPHQLTFRTYPTCRGQDRRSDSTNPLVLSVDRGALMDVEINDDWTEEINAVTVGNNDGVIRIQDSRVNASPLSRCEAFVSARTADVVTFADEGRARLWTGRPRRNVTGQLRETDQLRFGIHWGWGDYITLVDEDDVANCRIDRVRLQVEGGKEQIIARLQGE